MVFGLHHSFVVQMHVIGSVESHLDLGDIGELFVAAIVAERVGRRDAVEFGSSRRRCHDPAPRIVLRHVLPMVRMISAVVRRELLHAIVVAKRPAREWTQGGRLHRT